MLNLPRNEQLGKRNEGEGMRNEQLGKRNLFPLKM